MTVYIDTETTGLNHSDEVVEIAIIDDHQTLLNTLVKPVRATAWPEAQAIHGISPNDVKDAPAYDDIRSKIHELVAGHDVIIYNAGYDSMFLEDELKAAKSVQCCMLKYSRHYGEWDDYRDDYRWQKLTAAARHIGYRWEGTAHRALADTMATRAVWQYLEYQDGLTSG
ncbi:3'-5' exonuclease [Endozoicomonas lisbonensis]|uniref:DNA polymerase-3 subunit epsilon n=1 Tax=Endozoicomonas lisbonensis TaxID=3120522 RepID=A0ABV2SRL3_9GAMM